MSVNKQSQHLSIVHFLGSIAFGGIERMVFDLASEQQKQLQVHIVTGSMHGDFAENYAQAGLQIHNLNLKSGFDMGRSKRKILQKLFANCDVIHLHAYHPMVVWMAKQSGKALVYTEHGNFGFGRKVLFKDQLLFALRRRFFYHSKVQLCANSDFTRAYLEKHFYRGPRLQTVHNGTAIKQNTDRAEVQQLRAPFAGKFIISTTARLAGFKRIDRLLEVFAQFVQLCPDCVLWIIGDGPERKALEEHAMSLNISNKVVFIGYQRMVSHYQAACDLTVIPSQNEPFGLAAIEHYALRKPVLIFQDGGGLCEIVARQEPQDICTDQQAMLPRLSHYQQHPDGFELQEGLLAYFGVERMAEAYANIYQKLTHVRH